MKTRTKVCAALAAVLAVALAVIGLTWNASFVPDEATLPEKIRDFDNIGRETPLSTDVRVYDGVGIGSEAWYLIEVGEDLDLGYVKLEKIFWAVIRSYTLVTAAEAFGMGLWRAAERITGCLAAGT